MGFRDVLQECQDCNGTGILSDQEGGETRPCPYCGGTGYIVILKLSVEYKNAMVALGDKLDAMDAKLDAILEEVT